MVRRLLVLIFIFGLVGAAANPAQAQSVYYRWAFAPAVTCSTTMSGVQVLFASQPVEWLNVPVGAQFNIDYIYNGAETPSGPFPLPVGSGSFTYAALAMTGPSYPLTAQVRLETLVGGTIVYTSTLSATCTANGSTTSSVTNNAGAGFDNPCTGDGRVDGKCSDRVAVYCNSSATPPYLDIWGVDTSSKGVRLATFVFTDIVSAGPQGLTKALGNLGAISVAVDANNSFWVAWNGLVSVPSGSFYADGQPGHGFAKGFQCNFAR